MLYLFGQLALSDSLDYHENYQDDDFRPAAQGERTSASESDVRVSAADYRLRCSAHLPLADRASTSCLGN